MTKPSLIFVGEVSQAIGQFDVWLEPYAKRAVLGLSVAQGCDQAGVSQATFYADPSTQN